MTKSSDIVSYSSTELAAMRARGESRTDMGRVQAKTEAELERDIASDPDFQDVPADWYRVAQAVAEQTRPDARQRAERAKMSVNPNESE